MSGDVAREGCRKAELHGGRGDESAWLMLSLAVGWLSFSPLAVHARRLSPPMSRACVPVRTLTTRHDSACQWLALCSAIALSIPAALQSIPGSAHTTRHQPVSVAESNLVPARPIPGFRRVYRLADL
jgi:hypothetical protein